jgi:branched-chain amino acid transport system permease protein
MDLVTLSVVSGFTVGATYALIALGLVLIFRATEVFSFAHGQFILLGAYIVGRSGGSGPRFWLFAPLSLLVVGLIGVLCYRFLLRRLVGMPLFLGVIATMGISAIVDAVIGIGYGDRTYTIEIPGMPKSVYRIGDLGVTDQRLVIIVIAVLLAVGVAAGLRYTRAGSMVRAAGQDARLASYNGVNVHGVYAASWFIAGALAAIAGILYGANSAVTPDMSNLGLACLPAIVLGGLDSIGGALVGGIAIGILQGFVGTYIGGDAITVATYLILPIVLLVRPQGLFGTRQIARV